MSETFTPDADGPVVIIVTATAWTQSAPTPLGIEVYLDGVAIGSATVFANESAFHMAFPALFLNATITSNQPQKISIVATGNTVTDYNDNFSVQLLL